MKKLIIVIGLGMVALQTFAQAKKDSAAYSFSLQQAIDYAMQNQDNVKNAELDEIIAHKKVNEIMGMGLPQITSSFDLKNFLEIPTTVLPDFITPAVYGINTADFGLTPTTPYKSGDGIPAKFGTKYNASAGADASQLIFNGDYFLGLKASKAFVDISRKATQRTKIETAVAVSKAYYTVLVNQERMKLMDANVARIKKAMEDTKALLDNGFVEKIDYDRLSVTYNNLMVEQEKIQKLFTLGSYLLKYQMGMDIDANLTTTDKLEDVKLDVSPAATQFDYSKRVEYNLLENQFKLAKIDLKRQRYSYLPNAFAYGSFSYNALRNEFDVFDTKKQWYPTALIGARVTMPIFTGFQRHSKNQQAKLSVMKAENNMDMVKKSIDLDLAISTTSLQNASSSLETQKLNIKTAEEVYRVAKIKFEQGIGSNLEMISAETSLKESQTNYFNALYDAIIAKIDFDKANGTLIK